MFASIFAHLACGWTFTAIGTISDILIYTCYWRGLG